ncbi:MAG: response regulator, partial [Candidatus Hydrothermarchaeales archaeon]
MAETKLLIIDDDQGTRETLLDILSEKGYNVATASTGREAIDKAKKTTFNAALIDIKLLDMDGAELLRKFKKGYPEMVCIIITGHATIKNAIDALKDGANGYFIKPLVIEEVIHRLEEALDKQRLERERKQMGGELRKSEKQLEQKVKERTRELKTANTELLLLKRINEMLNRGTPLEEVFQTIVDGLAQVFGYDLTAIHILDEEKKHLVLKAYYAPSKIAKKIDAVMGVKARDLVIPLYKGGILNKIVKKKKAAITPNISWVVRSYTDKKALQALAPAIVKLSGVKWGMGVPLIVDDEVTGVIGCGRKKELTEEDADRLALFRNEVSLAIKNAQLDKELQKRAGELSELKEFNEDIVQRMDEGIMMLDPEGYITFANPRCERMLGYSRDELVGKPWTKLLAKDYAKKANTEATKWIKGEKTRFECALTSDYGIEIPVMISATPFQEDESVTSILLVLVDITESKARETKIKEEMLK